MISEADLRILHQRAGRKGGLQTQLQKKQERLSIYRSKLELAYSHYLHVLMLAGDILSFRYEPIRFNLAPRTSYTPDFLWVELSRRSRS
jgi:hypothetical protein